MSRTTPGADAGLRRTTLVWLVLVSTTLVSTWLGHDHPYASASAHLAGSVAIVLAVAKAVLIGWEFMELRTAPRGLQLALLTWAGVVGTGCVVLYAV